MFDKFGQAAKAMKMMNEQRKLQKQLSEMTFGAHQDGIRVVVTADLKIKEIEIDGEAQKKLVELLNKAMDESKQESQKIAMQKMQEMGIDLKSLLGGQ